MFGRDSESTLKTDRVRNMTEIRPGIAGFVSTCFIQPSFPESIRTTRHHSKPNSLSQHWFQQWINRLVELECVKDDIILYGMVKHVYSTFIPAGKTSSKMIRWLQIIVEQILVDASELRAPVEICSWSYVPGSKLPLFPCIRGWSST